MPELSRRIRAARAYAGMKQAELADALGVNIDTLGRWESDRLPAEFAWPGIIGTVAEATKLPPAFFTIEFDALAEPSDDQVIEAVRALGALVTGQLGALGEQVARNTARLDAVEAAVPPSLDGLTESIIEGLRAVGESADAPRRAPSDKSRPDRSPAASDLSPRQETRRSA